MNSLDEELVLSFDSENERFNYNRSTHPQCLELSKSLHHQYPGCTNCIITNSGLQAINCCIQGIVTYHSSKKYGKNGHYYDKNGNFATPGHDNYSYREMEHFDLVYANELYCDTPRLFKYLASMFAITTHKLNIQQDGIDIIGDFKKIAKQHGNTILFVESCSNPNGTIFDFSIIPKLKTMTQILYVVVDNTWLTDVILNPFSIRNNYNGKLKNDVDFVVTSLTKYYSGGTAIGGAIFSNNTACVTVSKISTTIHDMLRITGVHVSPFNCQLVCDALKTQRNRILSASSMTQKVILHLYSLIGKKKFPILININHPLTSKNCNIELAQKYFNTHNFDDEMGEFDDEVNNEVLARIKKKTIWPSVFTMTLNTSKDNLLDILKKQDKLDFKTSFGSKLSKVDPWPSVFEEYVNCRISIGYEDSYDRIISAIENILIQINTCVH
jgi:cystathionine beta-lyase/cystathionine gamma-synthase